MDCVSAARHAMVSKYVVGCEMKYYKVRYQNRLSNEIHETLTNADSMEEAGDRVLEELHKDFVEITEIREV